MAFICGRKDAQRAQKAEKNGQFIFAPSEPFFGHNFV